MEVTAKMVELAMIREEQHPNPYSYERLANLINAQLEQANNPKPNFQVNWDKQLAGCPILFNGKPVTFLGIEADTITHGFNAGHGLHISNRYTPNFTHPGHWIVDEPLRGKPDGLSDTARLCVKYESSWDMQPVIGIVTGKP